MTPPTGLSRRIRLLAAGSALLALAQTSASQVEYAVFSMAVDGHVLASHVGDVDGDDRSDVVLAVYSRANARRELQLFTQDDSGAIAPRPDRVIPVLEDVVSWAFADVRSEPGDELVFLTRSGAWSYSLTKDGYRGNIARLVEARLLYDVPDLGTLPYWPYVFAQAAGPSLLLPSVEADTIWAPGPAPGAAPFRAHASFSSGEALPAVRNGRRRRHSMSAGPQGVSVTLSDNSPFLDGDQPLVNLVLVSSRWRHRAPALIDVNGDGRLDLVRRDGGKLHVHVQADDGIPEQATRVEPYPDYVTQSGQDAEFELFDLDADGDCDMLVSLELDDDSTFSTSNTFDFLVLLNDGSRLFPEQPDQVLRFSGTHVTVGLAEVDGGGRPDLVFTKLQAPSLLELTTPEDITFSRMTLVHFGEGGGRFARRPSIKHEDKFSEDTLGEALVVQQLAWDCSGDGLADLVDVDLDGQVSIYRLVHETGLFSGSSWSLERSPYRSFPAAGSLRQLEVRDVNGDGLGDITTGRDDRFTLILSRAPGDRR